MGKLPPAAMRKFHWKIRENTGLPNPDTTGIARREATDVASLAK